MKIGLYNPYLKTLGGGEYYLLAVLAALGEQHQIDIFWDDPTILSRIQERFGLPVGRLRVVPDIWRTSTVQKLVASADYDTVFWVTDGSIPVTLAKKLIVIVQYPFPGGVSVKQRIKLMRTAAIVCYSEFVKRHLDQRWGVRAQVIPPGIDLTQYRVGEKQPLILSVGRFTRGKNAKKQEVLIQAFQRLYDQGHTLQLVLAGALLPEDEPYIHELKLQVGAYPITIAPNVPLEQLRQLYREATLYWHAAGYGEDLERFPERAEHFGITTVEAMASGSVPCVFAGGGQAEIVRNGVDGITWTTIDELVGRTAGILEQPEQWHRLAKAARLRANDYRLERTIRQFSALIEQ